MDKLNCLELYREAFPDNDIPFETALFEDCFSYCKYIKENGKIISMLFALPCELKEDNTKTECIYIYAAATLKEYRSKGYMHKLLEEVKKTDPTVFLRPANEGLIEYYKKFGFKCIAAQKCTALPYLKPKDGFKRVAEKFPEAETNENFTLMYFNLKKADLKINFLYSME